MLRSVLLSGVLLTAANALDICGNFCGPSWCDGQVKEECTNYQAGSYCSPSASDCQESGSTDGSCADSCCKTHDRCCGSSDRRGCNNAIINCLKACKEESGDHCYRGVIPIPVDVILTAMELDPYGCCGTKCSGHEDTAHLRGHKNDTISIKEQ